MSTFASFRRQTVLQFLGDLCDVREYGRLIASDEWSQRLREIAQTLRAAGLANDPITGDDLLLRLQPLAAHLALAPLIAWTVASTDSIAHSIFDEAKRHEVSGSVVVFLVDGAREWDINDPAPAVTSAVAGLDAWPGFSISSRSGAAAFVPISALPEFVEELKRIVDAHGPDSEESNRHYDEFFRAFQARHRPNLVIHLSDLHFGTDSATKNQFLLTSHLERLLHRTGRILITGDLMESPSTLNLYQLQSFMAALSGPGVSEPIVILGNHDERDFFGSGFRDLSTAMKLDREGVVVDDGLRTVFFCFDSSLEKVVTAGGKVSEDQSRLLGSRFEALVSQRPAIQGYSRVALVHHHPLPLVQDEEKIARYTAEWIEESLVGMDEGDEFLSRCARRGIRLVLHGHKHRARLRRKAVRLPGSDASVTVAGCGTSLGIRKPALSYNVLTKAVDGRWGISFVEGPADGSGFSVIHSTLV